MPQGVAQAPRTFQCPHESHSLTEATKIVLPDLVQAASSPLRVVQAPAIAFHVARARTSIEPGPLWYWCARAHAHNATRDSSGALLLGLVAAVVTITATAAAAATAAATAAAAIAAAAASNTAAAATSAAAAATTTASDTTAALFVCALQHRRRTLTRTDSAHALPRSHLCNPPSPLPRRINVRATVAVTPQPRVARVAARMEVRAARRPLVRARRRVDHRGAALLAAHEAVRLRLSAPLLVPQ